MPLPRPNLSATFELDLPVSKKKIKLRQFTVKEQHILLLADQTEELAQLYVAIKQIIQNCDVEETIEDIEQIPLAELEYIFMYLRGISFDNHIELRMGHVDNINNKGEECDHKGDFTLNIGDIQIENTELVNEIPLDDSGEKVLHLRPPTYKTVENLKNLPEDLEESQVEKLMIVDHIQMYMDGEEMFKREDYSNDEWIEFLDSMFIDAYDKLLEYFRTLPKMTYKGTYICSKCGCEERVEMEGLSDFL